LTEPAAAETTHVLDSPDATQRIIRGGIIRTGSYFASLLAGIAALPFLFRHLGVVDAGRYATVLSLSGIVGGIVENGLGAVSVREYALRAGDDSQELMRDLIGIRMGLFAVATIVTLSFLAVAGYPGILIGGAAVALCGAALESLGSVYGVWLSTNLHLGTMAVMQLVRNVVATVLTIALVIAGAPLIAFFILLIAAGLSQFLIALWATRGVIPHLPSPHVRSWWAFARASLPYILAMGLGVVYLRIAMVLMSQLTSEEQTGYFGVAFRLLEIVTLVSVLSLSSAFPILARSAQSDPHRHRYAQRRLVEVASIIGVGIALVTVIGAPTIVHVLAGDDFGPSVAILRVMAVSLAAKFLIAAWAFALLSIQAYADVLKANAAALLAAIVLTFVAVPLGDGLGGAIAIAVADLTLVSGYAIALHRNGFGLTIPARTGVLILGSAAVAAALAMALPIDDAARAIFASIVYVTLLLGTGAVPSEILGLLPGRRARQVA
jgi:O-antigen/teichoic acid export membrane protein